MAIALGHPVFGVIALPLLSLLYVRNVDIAALQARYKWKFRTKHLLALELCRKVMRMMRGLGSKAKRAGHREGWQTIQYLCRGMMTETISKIVSDRRPSHNDRRRQIARKMLGEAFLVDLPDAPEKTIFRDQIERLLALAV